MRRFIRKHPHVREEDGITKQIHHSIMETPPRAWGRREFFPAIEMLNRNTPTCVGKTRYPELPLDLIWKHPHVRGEDILIS
tara:strand:+ start:1668 stop:1910 length:243 start_codon:yes stop_codon:yes gene_type:complete